MFWTNHQLQLCDCKCTSCLAASCSRSIVAAQWSRSSVCQLEQILWQRAGVDLVAASWSRSSYSELQQIYSCSSVDLLIDNNKQKGKQVRLIFPIYQILTISNLLTIQYSVSSVIIKKKNFEISLNKLLNSSLIFQIDG